MCKSCVCVCVWSGTQSCPTLCGPVDCSLPGSSVHGVLQARIWEQVATSYLRVLPDPEIEPASLASPALAGVLAISAIWEAPINLVMFGTHTHTHTHTQTIYMCIYTYTDIFVCHIHICLPYMSSSVKFDKVQLDSSWHLDLKNYYHFCTFKLYYFSLQV